MTISILFLAFFVGYSYARLTKDEITRRLMYTRYSNAMLIFDTFAKTYDHYYIGVKDSLFNFDTTEWLW